jgi:hypothetical protein
VIANEISRPKPPDGMRTAQDVARFISDEPAMMRTLTLAAALDLPDAWIGAGFLRNALWDALHDRPWSAGDGDVDLIYFDPDDLDPATEKAHEAALREAAPDIAWSVKNQARMHLRNNDPPYRDTSDAMAHWLETCTAVAVRLQGGAVELLAPCGFEDLLALRVRPTPAGLRKPQAFKARVREKNWLRRWPRLHLG